MTRKFTMNPTSLKLSNSGALDDYGQSPAVGS